MSNIDNCHSVEDFRAFAKRKLPHSVFHYIDGGADDEITLQETQKPTSNAIWFLMYLEE